MTTHTPAPAQQDFVATELRGIIDVCGDSPTAIVSVERMRLWLSKLRAPVADERDRNATISQIVGLCNRIPGATTWNAAQFMYDEMHRRAALASAPIPKPWPVEEQPDGAITPVDPVDMASAPVAGEAIGYVDSLYLACRQRGLPCFGTIHHTPTSDATAPVYAAPQASAEDLRLRELLVRCQAWMLSSEHDRPNMLIALIQDALQSQPQADKGGAVDKSPNLQGSSVDRSTDLQGRGDDVVLPPLPSPPVHRGHALFAGSQMQTYARAAVLADRQERAGDAHSALTWYAEQVAGCRKLGPDGDAARNALDTDGGQRARAALSATQGATDAN
ncbi:hypothetical protein [Achromobacter dolens]|uniref:hypothetical protein n=1 Tax=Achromobacter dolens TaxID=1287738 RepID=UPI000E30EB95|nr:hypothetical protein [Achromobacter dolens]